VQRTVVDGQGNPLPTTGGAPADGAVSIEINGGASGLGPTEDNIVIGRVKLTADKRTNRIHIVSRPINMKLIRELVLEYDANVALPAPYVRPLRYRPVQEVIDALVSAIADPGDKSAAGGTGGTGTGLTGQRPTGQTGAAQNTSNFGNNRFGNNSAASSGFDSSGGSSALGETLSVQQVDTDIQSTQVGKSTIIGDKRNNSIIVVGTQDVKDKVSLLLDELDVRQAQVMIHTVIGELRLSKNENYGIEYILRNGGVLTSAGSGGTTDPGTGGGTTTNTSVVGFNDAGQGVLNLNNLISQQNITQILTGGSAGLSGVIISGNNFNAVVKAFEGNNRFRVVTRPSIFTSNAKRAVITSGEEVPVPTQIQSGFTGNTNNSLTTNSSIQFKPIELRLEVLPLINSDREVTLEIVQNISERAGSTIIDNNAIPNISRRALKTYVTVPNNGTLILGGLIKDSKDFTRNGIWKLSNLPLVGPLFGNTTKDRIRTELIVMMRPVVTIAPSDTAKLREKTFEGFAIPPDLESAIMPSGVWDKMPPRARIVNPRVATPGLRTETQRR
jgi:type II secretory pathway component GspD/PulD (secretin)